MQVNTPFKERHLITQSTIGLASALYILHVSNYTQCPIMCILFKLFKFKKLVEDCRVATHLCTKCFADLSEEELFAREELERMGESIPKIWCRSFNNRDAGNYVRVCFKMCEPMQYNIFKCCGCKCLEFDKDTEVDRLKAIRGKDAAIDAGEEVYEVDGRRLTLVKNDDVDVKPRGAQSYDPPPSQQGQSQYPTVSQRGQSYHGSKSAPQSHSQPQVQTPPHGYHDYNPKYSSYNNHPARQAPDVVSRHSHNGSRQMSRRGSQGESVRSRQMSRRDSRAHSQFSKRSAPRAPPPPPPHMSRPGVVY